MGDQTVGFGFQTDVVSAASLTHLITGRILKALSDGGVDFYAVSASMWLGKYIPVQSSLQTTVHSNLLAKGAVNGFLAKALSIGWGHSVVAVEMSRTKAGTNALLLIGALSSGCSYYVAAQCFSELLTICGCEADQAPNVDVIKPMIAYLAPFVQDLGFSKVLQHITTSVSHKTVRLCAHVPPGLNMMGESPVLAAAIKQLIFTSQKGENVYFVVRQRGAWMAAFANHVLGMAVEIVLGDAVLWASAGPHGSVIFDLGQPNEAYLTCKRAGIHLVDAPITEAGHTAVCIDYALSDALACELGHHAALNESAVRHVSRAITRMSSMLLRRLRMRSSLHYSTTHQSGGNFLSDMALLETLRAFDIDPSVTAEVLGRDAFIGAGWTGTAIEMHGLSYLNTKEATELKNTCPLHQRGISKLGRCLCCHVGGIIHGFASSILALLQCRYNANEVRVRAEALNGKISTAWSRGCILEQGECEIPVTSHQLFSHLSTLVHCIGSEVLNDSDLGGIPPKEAILGVSAGCYTIYYTCLIQDDCYDDYGRLITISTGRASIQGVLRKLLIETISSWDEKFNYDSPAASITRVAPGAMLEPHYRPTGFTAFMDVFPTETKFMVVTKIGTEPLHSQQTSISRSVHTLLALVLVGRPCRHTPDRPVQIDLKIKHKPAVTGFQSDTRGLRETLLLVALKGKRFEQLLNCHSESVVGRNTLLVWQLFDCLQCAIQRVDASVSKWADNQPFIWYSELVMAG